MVFIINIHTKTYLYNLDPLNPHSYIVKLGFTGVYIIFLISAQKYGLWILFRTPSLKVSEFFLSKKFQFLEVKFSICLNRPVFIMWTLKLLTLLVLTFKMSIFYQLMCVKYC